MIQKTTSLLKIAALKKRIKVIRGGQGAGKTISILILLINHAASKPDKEILILSSELTKMRLTVIKDFVKLMRLIGIYDDSRFLAGTLYRFPNGSFIKFIGLDKSDVGKGLRSDVAYFNEVNKIDFESYRQVASRAGQVYADYNPDAEFYIDTDVVGRPDCDFLQLTFKDNELLSENERSEILNYYTNGYYENGEVKNKYWANLWNVYGLGNIGNLQGVIFENWNEVDAIPPNAEFISYGMDWGFTNDPTTLIEVYRYNGELYVNELIYQTGLTNSDIVLRMNELGINKYADIIADSAEPKSIEDIYRGGFKNIYPALKGSDSIRNSIDTLQQFTINITKSSTNLIKEFRTWRWAVDKEGKQLGTPIDKNNHCFTADTLITTINGQVPIINVKVGDLVLTSKGYKKVLKTFDNGVKDVNKYSMQFDTNLVYLCSTKEHKIKTKNGWKTISELKAKDVMYQLKHSTEKNTSCIQEKGIIAEGVKGCIQKYGNFIMELFQKATIYITLTEIKRITILQTLILLKHLCILDLRVRKELKKTLNGLKTFIQKVLSLQKNGTNLKREKNGIRNMVKKCGLIENIKRLIVNYAEKNTKLEKQQAQNIAIKTVKLKHLDLGESHKANVYDLMIEDEHEYFANGILVHNCIDALRYVALNKINKSSKIELL